MQQFRLHVVVVVVMVPRESLPLELLERSWGRRNLKLVTESEQVVSKTVLGDDCATVTQQSALQL
jgi:hypothetical protein